MNTDPHGLNAAEAMAEWLRSRSEFAAAGTIERLIHEIRKLVNKEGR